jgi:ATP-dependent RNA helicase DDX46/PRP5
MSEANKRKAEEDVEDIDPLDAYMADLQKTLRKDRNQPEMKKARVVVLDSAGSKDASQKGEIIENEDETGPVVDDFDLEQAAQQSLISKGRQLPQTNHEKVYYRPFRKDFYIEVPELQRMTKKEVEEYRHSLDEIKVRGVRCPKPIKNWAQAGVESKVLNILKR